jgi:hypothetical protein
MADIKDAGALVGISRYGIPWHGRIEGGTLYTGLLDEASAEVTRTWEQPVGGDCFLIQKPGLPDPYLDAAAAKTAAALRGHELTNYALICGAGDIHGIHWTRTASQSQRWIWFDADGLPFLVTFGLVGGSYSLGPESPLFDGEHRAKDFDFSDDWTARFEFTRFGDLRVDGDPAPTVTFDLEMATGTIGQGTPTLSGISGGNMIVRAIIPTGERMIAEIHSQVYDLSRGRAGSTPLGFIEFTISGTGAAPSVAFSVLANRAATIGSGTSTQYIHRILSWTTEYDYTKDATTTATWAYADRIIGYAYDSALDPLPITLDLTVVSEGLQNINCFSWSTAFGTAHTYDDSYTTDQTVTAEITVDTETLTATGSNLNTEYQSDGTIDPSSSNVCLSSTDRFFSAPGMTSSTDSTSNTTCLDYVLTATEQDPAYDLDFEDTVVYPISNDDLFSSPLSYWCRVYRYSSQLFTIKTVKQLVSSGDPSYQETSQGAIGYDVLDATLRDFALASHGSYNPATDTLAFPKTAAVNFT